MPLYEYECESCHHRFEKIQKYSDPLIDICPSCGGVVKKLFSSPSFQFKGSGFYATDYAKKPRGDSGGHKESNPTSASSDSSAASSSPTTSTTPATTSSTSGESSKKD
ncbi:MAG: FmdB family zinc ribbon protein [Vicinamibacterales bacterium]